MAVYNDCSLRQYLCKNNTNLTETCQILFKVPVIICIIKLPPHSYGEFHVDVTRERSGIELQRTIIVHHNQNQNQSDKSRMCDHPCNDE